MTIARGLRGFLAFLSAVAYIGFIIYIGIVSIQSPNEKLVVDANNKPVLDDDGKQEKEWRDPPEFPAEVTTLLSIMSTALAVHTGTVLGLETDSDRRNRREKAREERRKNSDFLSKLAAIADGADKGLKKLWGWGCKGLLWVLDHLGETAALVYVLGLLIAVGFHFFGERFSPASAPFLRDSWTALVGIFAGIWSVRDGG